MYKGIRIHCYAHYNNLYDKSLSDSSTEHHTYESAGYRADNDRLMLSLFCIHRKKKNNSTVNKKPGIR